MVERRLFLLFFAITLLVLVSHAERTRNDDLQVEEIDFVNDNTAGAADDSIEITKRFLRVKKKTAQNPSSDANSGLLEKTAPCRIKLISRKSSALGKKYRKKSDTNSASRYNRIRSRIRSTKGTCGVKNPCRNGGTCKPLSRGRHYCRCPQDYYGKICARKFKDAIETKKRFSKRTKKTARNSSSDAVSDFLEKTPPCIIPLTSRKSSATGEIHRKKSDTNSTSQYNRIRSRIKPTKDACGIISPCKNGGTCKSLSNGSYYCFCSQDYYGKTCKNKFVNRNSHDEHRSRINIDHCAKSPCHNGGECVGLRTTYYCRCKSPYSGITCDKRIDNTEDLQ